MVNTIHPVYHRKYKSVQITGRKGKKQHQGTGCWPCVLFFLNFYLLFVYYFFLAVLGLRFCARAFSSCGKRGPLFIAMRGPLTIAASLVAEHRLQTRRLSSCGSRAQLLRGMWDLSRPGLEPVSPALAGRFSTTAPPGKPALCSFIMLKRKMSNTSIIRQSCSVITNGSRQK